MAAASAATPLRGRGYEGEVVLVGDEPVVPYERRPLSKDFLLGGTQLPDLHRQAPGWYETEQVELRLGIRVTAVDVGARSVTLSTGDRLGYDDLVLATGVRARRLPGFDGDGVHYLRTAADAARLREELAEADRIAVLGAGFVGCEVAPAAASLGKQVTVFEPEPVPLARALGEAIGTVLMDIHREHRVEIRAGEHVTSFERGSGGFVLTTGGGERIEVDVNRGGRRLAAERGAGRSGRSGRRRRDRGRRSTGGRRLRMCMRRATRSSSTTPGTASPSGWSITTRRCARVRTSRPPWRGSRSRSRRRTGSGPTSTSTVSSPPAAWVRSTPWCSGGAWRSEASPPFPWWTGASRA
ncbi:ferredoxin--NAD(+) reductase [Amycolatopsis methanolica 239]|uniref:Ferredoxin--NAD(+) reductase n=1 Tax=Amycolatopsis methanolica 239 TaxID=1068978 RepID=A0A076MW84_AMYME|nr:ferredoxin--NAD(+) reductase [Amycolatopsis methanolica 239]